MAGFTRVHGDTLPLVNMDMPEGEYGSTSIPVNIAGPKLDFFSIRLSGGSPAGQMGTGGAVEAVIKCVQQLATVYMYQVEDTGSNSNLSLAVYPTAAWTSGALSNAIEGLGTVNGYDLGSTTVENNGFRLDFYC